MSTLALQRTPRVNSRLARYVARRLALALLTLALVTVAVFAITNILPGNPAEVRLGPLATPAALKAEEHRMGLDRQQLDLVDVERRRLDRRNLVEPQLGQPQLGGQQLGQPQLGEQQLVQPQLGLRRLVRRVLELIGRTARLRSRPLVAD